MTDDDKFAYACMRLGSQMRGFASGLEPGEKNAFLIAMLRDSADHLLTIWNDYAVKHGMSPIPGEDDEH